MGKIINMPPINDLRNYYIGFCNHDIDIDDYRIGFLKMLPFEVRNVEIKLIQFDTNGAKRCLFEIYQNYIVKCFSSWFAIVHYQIDNIKLIILYSKWYKTEIFKSNWNKIEITLWKSRFGVKIEVKSIFIYKMVIIDNLNLWPFTFR